MKIRYQLLLLACLVLAAFYPAVLAGASRIDDYTLLQALERVTGWNLRNIFFPSAGGLLYYRPLIVLSYVFDKHVLGLHPGMMHVENILLHLVNAVLVYYLTAQAIKKTSSNENGMSFLPLIAAVLFGLHPVNSESVNWISGRTDVLAGVFILSSALALLKYEEQGQKQYMVFSIIAFFFGVLSKETAITFFPGFLMLMRVDRSTRSTQEKLTEGRVHQRLLGEKAVIILSASAVILLAVLFRSLAFTSNSSRIGITINAISTDWLHSLLVVLRAFGFYMKKLVVPYPLNFSIMEVDPLYEVLAVPLAALCVYVALRGTALSAFFMTGVFLIFPAFLPSFGQIAWTPYAERYLYLSSAFITIAAVVYAAKFITTQRLLMMKTALTVIIVVMFATTFGRSMVWQNDFDLVKDTIEKSPRSRDMRVVYASLLSHRGDYALALTQLQYGSAISLIGIYDERYDLNRAFIAIRQGRIDDAVDIYNQMLKKTNRQSTSALQNLVSLLEEKQDDTHQEREKRLLKLKILSYNEELYRLTRDPHLSYKIGKNAASLDLNQKALLYYRQAYDGMSPEDPYKRIAITRITRLPVDEHLEHAKDYK